LDFYKAVQTRRSVRSFKKDPIPDNVLNKILEATRIAPSGANRQPWHFIVVKDELIKQKTAQACNNQKFMVEAPVIIVACGKRLLPPSNMGGYMGEMGMLVDVAIAFTHLILAARVEGLGTCWIGAFDNDALKKLLKVGDGYEVVAATPLGYPSDPDLFTKFRKRKNLDEISSMNRF
jgi:nitroreductase